ncbi:hypothetical protein OG407_08875 [Streptomyces sp. NBC_01515]|uniref:MmyB family transcriptional regulator n=1 Tax=Streptomyces sp. NBC_01515 TaxID=2903890 RepID=UPI00386FEB4C
MYRADTLRSFGVPAVIQGRDMDVLAANRLGSALFTDFQARPHRERDSARFVFLAAARSLYIDWGQVAGDCVAILRLYAGRHPSDPQLADLIGELSRPLRASPRHPRRLDQRLFRPGVRDTPVTSPTDRSGARAEPPRGEPTAEPSREVYSGGAAVSANIEQLDR